MPDSSARKHPAQQPPNAGSEPAPTVTSGEIDAVLEACRSLVAVAVASLEVVADEVDMIQLRVLVVVAARGTASLKDVADGAGLHLSRASRACERLVGQQLITRTDDPADRRVLRLELTEDGQRVLDQISLARRATITPALSAMPARRRVEMVRALRAFTAAMAEPGVVVPDAGAVSALGWMP